MDPLSISASVAGLITISTQILSVIGAIKSKSNKGLDALSREVVAVRGILCQIQQIIQFQSTKPTKSVEWLDTLNTTLNNCGDTYLTLQKELEGLRSSSKLGSLKMKVKWTLKDGDIQDMMRSLESYKLSLDLLLSVQTSTTTTNIEDILVQVHKKLSLRPAEPTAVKTPLSWRKKLAGLNSGNTGSQNDDDDDKTAIVTTGSDASSTTSTIGAASDTDTSYIIAGPKTVGWDEPGFYGISRDEGDQAPDLNSPDLTSICEMKIGKQSVSLLCGWEEPLLKEAAIGPMRLHILFKGPLAGDVYFMQLHESSAKSLYRFFTPVARSGLIIARCDLKDTACPLDDLAGQDSPEDYRLALGEFALKSTTKSEQVLIVFENSRERDTFLGHLYAARYLQRMKNAFGMPGKLYHGVGVRQRTRHVQVGYADGTEKSYIYHFVSVEYSLDDRAPRLTCTSKALQGAGVFYEDLLHLDINIVGRETLVCSAPDGNEIRTISITFGCLSEVLQMYYCLQEIMREWSVLSTTNITDYEIKKEWAVQKLGFWEKSTCTRGPFHQIIVVAKVDKTLMRLMMDVYNATRTEKLASFYVMPSSIIWHKNHLRASSPDFFVYPVMQVGFWDLREGSDTSEEKYKQGQVRMNDPFERQLCDDLEKLVEDSIEGMKDAQKRLMIEINRMGVEGSAITQKEPLHLVQE